MLSEQQKRLIEMQAAEAIRQSWGGLNGTRARGIIDDIRAKVVEEAWFGKPVTDQLNEMRYLASAADTAGLGRLYEIAADRLDAAHEAVLGKAAREPEAER